MKSQPTDDSHFRAAIEAAPNAFVSADSRGNIIFWNPSATRMFGYLSGEVLGKPLTILMPDRFRDGHRHGLSRFVKTGEAHVIGKTVELAARRRDGTEFPMELSLAVWERGGRDASPESSATSPTARKPKRPCE